MGYTQDLAAHWDLSTDNPADICWRGNRYPGTGANIVGHPNGIAGGRCAEFNGNNSNVNVGNVVELNAVEKLTLAFWMNQDVLGANDIMFIKSTDATHEVRAYTLGGVLVFAVRDGFLTHAWFDHSTVTSAGAWLHIACVFDGTQVVLQNRFAIYANGVRMVLLYSLVAATPAVTADMSGIDATIGVTVGSFDGKLDEPMIFSSALTQLQVADLINRTRQGRF